MDFVEMGGICVVMSCFLGGFYVCLRICLYLGRISDDRWTHVAKSRDQGVPRGHFRIKVELMLARFGFHIW